MQVIRLAPTAKRAKRATAQQVDHTTATHALSALKYVLLLTRVLVLIEHEVVPYFDEYSSVGIDELSMVCA